MAFFLQLDYLREVISVDLVEMSISSRIERVKSVTHSVILAFWPTLVLREIARCQLGCDEACDLSLLSFYTFAMAPP